jgi:SAM-dependent methyltransferase
MSQPPNFEQRDATQPEFWNERFAAQFVPWDKGGVPKGMQRYFESLPRTANTQCLIPGCGNGYEAAYLSEQGWDVVAIDFSPVAVASARLNNKRWADRIILADFFSYAPVKPLQCIYERAFLCALPPTMRSKIIERWAALLPVGGLLLGYFFIESESGKKGPPFAITSRELTDLLSPYFECIEDNPVTDSIAVFENRERWQVWRKRI